MTSYRKRGFENPWKFVNSMDDLTSWNSALLSPNGFVSCALSVLGMGYVFSKLEMLTEADSQEGKNENANYIYNSDGVNRCRVEIEQLSAEQTDSGIGNQGEEPLKAWRCQSANAKYKGVDSDRLGAILFRTDHGYLSSDKTEKP